MVVLLWRWLESLWLGLLWRCFLLRLWLFLCPLLHSFLLWALPWGSNHFLRSRHLVDWGLLLFLAFRASDKLLPLIALLFLLLFRQVFSTLELVDETPSAVNISLAQVQLTWVLEIESISEEGNGFISVFLELSVSCLCRIVAHDDPLKSVPVDEDRIDCQAIDILIIFLILHKILDEERRVREVEPIFIDTIALFQVLDGLESLFFLACLLLGDHTMDWDLARDEDAALGGLVEDSLDVLDVDEPNAGLNLVVALFVAVHIFKVNAAF